MHKLGSAAGCSVLFYMLVFQLIKGYQEQMFYNRLIKRLYFVKTDDDKLFETKKESAENEVQDDEVSGVKARKPSKDAIPDYRPENGQDKRSKKENEQDEEDEEKPKKKGRRCFGGKKKEKEVEIEIEKMDKSEPSDREQSSLRKSPEGKNQKESTERRKGKGGKNQQRKGVKDEIMEDTVPSQEEEYSGGEEDETPLPGEADLDQRLQEEIASHWIPRLSDSQQFRVACCHRKCGRNQFKRMVEIHGKGVDRAKEELNIVNIIKNVRHLTISEQCSTLITKFRKEKIQHTLENLILLDQEDEEPAAEIECINEDEIDF